jgi:GH24 family phage-related lysozyme (muramidase)
MAHYKSITVTNEDGKHYNIRSVVNGKQLSDEDAKKHAEKNKSFGKAYDDIPTAVEAAEALSKTQKMPTRYTDAQKQIRADEGELRYINGGWGTSDNTGKHEVYYDSKGYLTAGNGHKLNKAEIKELKDTHRGPPLHTKEQVLELRKGKGAYQLTGRTVTDDEADEWFAADLKDANDDVKALYKGINMPEEQREVLVNMAFNLGRDGLREFKQMRKGLVAGDSKKVADEMKDSDWYEQVKGRGKRLVEQVSKIPSTGKFDPKLDALGMYDTEFREY